MTILYFPSISLLTSSIVVLLRLGERIFKISVLFVRFSIHIFNSHNEVSIDLPYNELTIHRRIFSINFHHYAIQKETKLLAHVDSFLKNATTPTENFFSYPRFFLSCHHLLQCFSISIIKTDKLYCLRRNSLLFE